LTVLSVLHRIRGVKSFSVADASDLLLRANEAGICYVGAAAEAAMEDQFDPYYQWLGISPQEQPPHHYRLLGINLFESDPDVILNAANARIARIKSFQKDSDPQTWQRIMGEISAARVCLLDKDRRAESDSRLRRQLEARRASFWGSRLGQKQVTIAAGTATSQGRSEPASQLSDDKNGARHRWGPWRLGLLAAAVTLLAVGLSGFLTRDDNSAARKAPRVDLPKPAVVQCEASEQTSPPTLPDQAEEHQPAVELPAETPAQEPPELKWASVAAVNRPPEVGPSGADGSNLPGGDGVGELKAGAQPKGKANPEARKSPPVGPASLKKLPVPTRAQQRAIEKETREVFKEEFAAASSPRQRIALAKELFDHGLKASDDPATAFVLLRMGCDLAAGGGELSRPLEIIEQIKRRYDVDTLAMKEDVVAKVVESMRPGLQNSPFSRQIADAAMLAVDEALDNDDYDVAGRLLKRTLLAARKARNSLLIRQITERSRDVSREKQRFAPVKKALETLAKEPADGEASLTAGRWYCFTRQNWDKGLPHLKAGADPALAKLAQRDLSRPGDPQAQVQLGDDWCKLSENEQKLAESAIQSRAAHWYRMALPKLSGLEKVKIEKWLEARTADADRSQSAKRGVVEMGNVALAINGTRVSDNVERGAMLFDGDTTSAKDNRASGRWPCQWIITLGKVYRLQEIRIKLDDHRSLTSKRRAHLRYAVHISADGKEFIPLVDRSRGQWFGWQQITFPPQPVKAIKLSGLYNDSSVKFTVVELEAYCIPPSSLRR